MQEIGKHAHIAAFIACVTEHPQVCLIIEYCANGDLLHYLRNNRPTIIDASCN